MRSSAEAHVPDCVLERDETQRRNSQHRARPSRSSTTAHLRSIDELKFRIVVQRGMHYFRDVRLKSDHPLTRESAAVVKFFEGRCLEQLDKDTLAQHFGRSACLPHLQKMIGELQEVLCD